MKRRAFFNLQDAKRAVAPFFFDGWIAIGLLFVVALGITFALTGAEATAEGLFQSPQSPVEAAPPPAEAQPAQPAPAEAQPPPAQPAPAEAQQQPPEQPAPAEAAPPTAGESQTAPADAGQAPLPPPLPEPERPSRRDSTPPGDGEPQMVLDRAEFVDTVVVSVAYVWLCCGIVLILFIPLIFLFLHIRGRSKIIKEERY